MNLNIQFAFASAALAFVMPLANAQSASYYQQAASLYDQAAAKCSEPGASCMRQYASYNRCLAGQYSGSGSCGSGPSCSTACPSSAPSGGTNSTRSGSIGASNQTQQLANEIGDLLGQWSAARDAKHEREAEELQRKLEREAAQMEADSAAEDERARERAAFLADPSGASMPANPTDQGDDTAKLRAQLYAEANADSGTPPAQTAAADPSDQQAQLRNQFTAQARQQAETDSTTPSVTVDPQPVAAVSTLAVGQPALPANLVPQDQQLNAAFQDSVDQPDPNQTGSLAQMFQSTGQEIKDGLNNLVTSGKTLTSDLMSDPVVQWAVSDKGSLTTIPPPTQGDSPDTATNKVYGQAVVGFGDLIKGIAGGPVEFAKALYGYGTTMVDQMGADLGLASGVVFETPPGGSQ
jgi:hypothetical protein